MYIYEENPDKEIYTTLGARRGACDAATLPTDDLERCVTVASDKAENAHFQTDRWYYSGYLQGAQGEVVKEFESVPSYIERVKDGREAF